jgi:hypothetical protein
MLCRCHYSSTDALPSCCSGGCRAASVSTLRQMLCCCERDGPPSADALPHWWSSSQVNVLPVLQFWRMLCHCYHVGALGGCFAAEVDAGLVAFAVFTILLATDVSSSCNRLNRLGILGGGSPLTPSCFLAFCLCSWDFVGNPGITCESYIYLCTNSNLS